MFTKMGVTVAEDRTDGERIAWYKVLATSIDEHADAAADVPAVTEVPAKHSVDVTGSMKLTERGKPSPQ